MENKYLSIYKIPNDFKPELLKHEKIKMIDDIFKKKYELRTYFLMDIVESYFTQLGQNVPDDLINDNIIKPILYPFDKTSVKKALANIKQYAIEYHSKSKKVYLNDSQKDILMTLLRKTFYGYRLNEMGLRGNLKDDINNNVISKKVLELIINKLFIKEIYSKDMIIAYGSIENIIKAKLILKGH